MNAKTRRHLEILREVLVALVVLVSVGAAALLAQARPAQQDEAQVAMLDELGRLVTDEDAEPQSRAEARDLLAAAANAARS
jgi:hypothetical protein